MSSQVTIIRDPLTGNVKIETLQDQTGEMKISLTDIKGIPLFAKISKEKSITVDTRLLPAGMYFIRVSIGYKVLDYKFVKVN
ncbi:MAG: T9SS type A sorting domain-containing protein [Bacteroidales bacterium]|nr:T9SS type A sorting domain-containing protein [Bacteroidales bacterium]